MQHPLQPRDACHEDLRTLCEVDPAVGRYALLYALELLDLGGVNQVLSATTEFARALFTEPGRLAALRRERFGK